MIFENFTRSLESWGPAISDMSDNEFKRALENNLSTAKKLSERNRKSKLKKIQRIETITISRTSKPKNCYVEDAQWVSPSVEGVDFEFTPSATDDLFESLKALGHKTSVSYRVNKI